MKSIGISLVFLFCLAFASCLGFNYDVTVLVDFDQKAFRTQRDMWLASRPANYRFHLKDLTGGEYFADTIITVRNNEFVSHEWQHMFQWDSSVEKMFAVTVDDIYDSIMDDYLYYHGNTFKSNDSYLKSIAVKYDKDSHIPVRITYQYYMPDGTADAIDLWIRTIQTFEVLEDIEEFTDLNR